MLINGDRLWPIWNLDASLYFSELSNTEGKISVTIFNVYIYRIRVFFYKVLMAL